MRFQYAPDVANKVWSEAIKQLENLLNVASEAGELQAQASACLNLGIVVKNR